MIAVVMGLLLTMTHGSIPLSSLMNHDVTDALRLEGVLEITGIPALAEARQQALHDALDCMEVGSPIQSVLEDGTRRKTLAGLTTNGILGSMLLDHCEAFSLSSDTFRRIVTRVSNAFIQKLHETCGGQFLVNGTNLDLRDFVSSGQQLEHFHSYQPSCNSLPALDVHTDEGLFIAVTKPEWNGGDIKSGFTYQTSSGSMVDPDLKDDSIFFMVGAGANEWLPRCSLRAVPHSLTFSNCGHQRVWYGRMFLPPADASHPLLGISFRDLKQESVSRPLQAGCAAGSIMRDLGSSCGSGEMFCWMGCQPYASGCSDSDQICMGTSGSQQGFIWTGEQDGHCQSCIPVCNGTNIHHGTGICNGLGTSMNMFGFVSGLEPEENCIVLLFDAWLLDTPGKFAAGAIGSFAFAIFVELFMHIRQSYFKNNASFYIVSFFIQIILGYLVMLIAMTYCVTLFVAVCAGLVLGHLLFHKNSGENSEKNADPCCKFMEGLDD